MELWRLLICAKYFSEESVRERGAMGCSVRLFVNFRFYQIFILTGAPLLLPLDVSCPFLFLQHDSELGEAVSA